MIKVTGFGNDVCSSSCCKNVSFVTFSHSECEWMRTKRLHCHRVISACRFCTLCHKSLQLDEPRAFPVSANFSSMMSEYPQPAPTWAESVSSAVPTERFEEGCRTFELYRPQHITQHTDVATMLPLIRRSQTFSSIFTNSLPFFSNFFLILRRKIGYQ